MGLRAILHIARKRPETLLSDDAMVAKIRLKIQRIKYYALELSAGKMPAAASKPTSAKNEQMLLFNAADDP
jgi:hypothetical protein